MAEKRGGRGDSQDSHEGEVSSTHPTVSGHPSPRDSFTFLQRGKSDSLKNSPDPNKSSQSNFNSKKVRKSKGMENSPSSSQTKSIPSFTSTQSTASPSSPVSSSTGSKSKSHVPQHSEQEDAINSESDEARQDTDDGDLKPAPFQRSVADGAPPTPPPPPLRTVR